MRRHYGILGPAFGMSLLAVLSLSWSARLPAQTQPDFHPSSPAASWEPPRPELRGSLTAAQLKKLPDTAFAFPRVRKEPLTDAAHVRSALARFRHVKGVSDAERDLAFANIRKAAEYFGVTIKETDWRELGKRAPSHAAAPPAH